MTDPITKEPYTRDPRNIAIKAEKYLKSTGIGDVAYFGPEPEFFIFDEVRYDAGVNQAFHRIDSIEGQRNTGREVPGGNLGYKPRYKEGYFPVAPTDSQQVGADAPAPNRRRRLRLQFVRVVVADGADAL